MMQFGERDLICAKAPGVSPTTADCGMGERVVNAVNKANNLLVFLQK